MGTGPAEWKRQEITGARPHAPEEQQPECGSFEEEVNKSPRLANAGEGGASASTIFLFPKLTQKNLRKRQIALRDWLEPDGPNGNVTAECRTTNRWKQII